MTARRLLLVALALVAAAQLAVPLSMVFKHERTLSEGEVFRFKTAPVDPVDAFRGRFVALGIKQASAPATVELERNRKVYASLGVDEDGYAYFTSLSTEPPSGPYLKVRLLWKQGEDRYHLRVPFDRYYMPEDLAPRAEAAYLRGNRRGERNAFIQVRIRDGFGVIEDLYLDGLTVREHLEAIDG